ncbi:MAG: hypothetical protein QOH58_2509 [Thermoleophilaceae bacterium]|jgi:hypothetical protein|nr:hypothetical protein [Thermoleophilaceae bacterium]
MAPSVLFLADPREDYVADSLFHGLRSVLGDRAVDFPKREFLYSSFPAEQRERLYGRGFSIYGQLEDIEVDRDRPLERMAAGEFDLVVVGTIWRDWHWWRDVRAGAPSDTRLAVVDGADVPWMYPYGPTWWRSPRGWLLPRAHRRAAYFKREWTPATGRLRWYGLAPGAVADRLPLHEIAISYPEEKLASEAPPKRQQFPAHVVDPELAARLPDASSGYAFSDEAAYTDDLRASRFGITTRKAGWDAMRHYELAANGAVPCFRDLDEKPARCAPHGLEPGQNCLSYRDADDLLAQVEAVTGERYGQLVEGALQWASGNTTRRRAEQFLQTLGLTA